MNSTNHINNSKQSGAALITCLALLVVLTLIGLSSMTTTTLEEKMTGTVYNKQTSFQAAEAVLRDGENYALNILNEATVFGSEPGLYDITNPSDPNYPVWDSINAKDYNGWYTNTNNPAAVDSAADLGVAAGDPADPAKFDPSFIIENYTGSPLDVNCGLDASKAVGSECELDVYRITARSHGLNDQTSTILQTTYKVFR